MKPLLLSTLLLMSTSLLAETNLECYEKYHASIEVLDTAVIKAYSDLFKTESTLLDQYFNPGNYYNGPHNPYKYRRKQLLLSERNRYKTWIDEKSLQSQELSRELTACLKYAND